MLASTSFANGQANFSSNVDVLRRSGALVVVLFCQATDASRFIQATQDAGLANITWVGSESVTTAVRSMVASSPDQASRLRGLRLSSNQSQDYRLRAHVLLPPWIGFAGLGPSSGVGEAYTSFQARLNAFSATVIGDGWCSNATDDEGRLLWATADGRCLWAGGDPSTDVYAAFAYDAVYALANAMHRTLAAAPGASLDGWSLMGQLLNTSFLGASGLVGFDEHGDRDVGISYEVYNVATQGMPLLGQWQQGVTWSARFTSSVPYVAADGSSEVAELVGSGLLLQLGVLCIEGAAGSNINREEFDHVLHTGNPPALITPLHAFPALCPSPDPTPTYTLPTVDRINDKTDGWYDELLPDHTIVTATQSVGCVVSRARIGWRALEASLPGFTAVIGPACSDDVADLTDAEWRARYGSRAVVISPASSAPNLANEIDYPNLARTTGTDVHRARAFAELCKTFGWDRMALLHDDSVWGRGAAAALKTSVAAVKGEVIRTVDFALAAFDDGSVHARELLDRLEAASPRVIVLATQQRVQRAICAQHRLNAELC